MARHEVRASLPRRATGMTELLHFLRSSVRGRLACLVLAITLPAMSLVTLLVVQAYRNEREAVSQHLLATARSLAAVVDSEVAESEWLLRGLASARSLETGDLRDFEKRLRSLELGPDRWLVLEDASGQQLVNTRLAPGARLHRVDWDGEFRAAMARGETHVSNLIFGGENERPLLFVAVPVLRDGQVRYTLRSVMLPSALAGALNVERQAPRVMVSVLDRAGKIVVRHPDAQRFVGRSAAPDLSEAARTHVEGTQPSVLLDGVKVQAALSRASRSGWCVVLGAPYAALYASARELLMMGLAVSGVLMAVAIFMALWIGRAVVRGVDSLVAETDALGRSAGTEAKSSGLQETDYVAAAMRKSAERLAQRERDNAGLTAALKGELKKLKRAEEANRQLAAIVESSDDAIIAKDLAGTVTSWNGGAERMFGFTAAEIVGQPIFKLLPPDRQVEEQSILARIQRGERVAHFETFRRRKDGTQIAISLSVSPVLDSDGRVVGASKIARDISQRKRAEAQQHALFELVAAVNRAVALPDIYEAALTAMVRCQNADRAAILLCDADGVMRFRAVKGLSEEYCRAVEGHSPWKAGDSVPQLLWIDDVGRATVAAGLRQAIEREGIRALAFVPLTYQGRLLGKFMVYYNAPHAFAAAELRPVQAIASQVVFAIERQRSAQALEALVDERTASLRQAVAQMEEFSYSVSHDLRAPTRAMSGYAEAILVDHGAQLDDVGRDLLKRIMRSSRRMDQLIQDLLTYSRISRREIELTRVSLDKLVREVTQQYPELRAEHADIAVEGVLPDVIGHEPSLTQVFSNLLTNAVKFVAPGVRPRVRVRQRMTDGRVRVVVEDNGIGVKPEVQSRLFRMFERVHPDQHYEGTGIGLAIVRKAIERMNGTVGLESDGVTGARFWFELPAAESEVAPVQGETQSATAERSEARG